MKKISRVVMGLAITLNIAMAGNSECQGTYYKKDGAKGVTLCVSHYTDDNIVQIIDLSKGASLNLLYKKGKKKDGTHLLKLQKLSSFWNQLHENNIDTPFSVINGTFFEGKSRFDHSYNVGDERKLAFTIKNDKETIKGYMKKNIKVLHIKGTNAFIQNSYKNNLKDYNLVIGGYSIATNNKNSKSIGRNFIGVKNNIIYNLISKSMTAKEARKTLNKYGVSNKNILVLDGGPSAHFISDSHEVYVDDYPYKTILGMQNDLDRPVAQAIGVTAGNETFSINLKKSSKYNVSVKIGTKSQNVIMSKSSKNLDVLSWKDSNLKFSGTNYCLNAYHPRRGSNVNSYICNENDREQQWKYSSRTGLIQLKGTNLCLNSYKTKEGSNLNLWTCNRRDRDQIFKLR